MNVHGITVVRLVGWRNQNTITDKGIWDKPPMTVDPICRWYVGFVRKNMDQFYRHLNTIAWGITFTKEEIKVSILPFLDKQMMRNSSSARRTTVYRKPTTTDRIVNFKGYHPTCHLIAVCVPCSIELTHFSTHNLQNREQSRMFQLFGAKGYPTPLINACTRRKQRANT